MTCALCREPITPEENGNKGEPMHRECMLRSTMGGIGHFTDHQHWCIERSDPDAGLSFRLSSLLIAEVVRYLGVEESVRRSHYRPGDLT